MCKTQECALVGCIPRNLSPVYRICRTRHLSVSGGGENRLTFLYSRDWQRVSLARTSRTIHRLSFTPYPVSCVGISDYHAVSVFLRFYVAASESPFQNRLLITLTRASASIQREHSPSLFLLRPRELSYRFSSKSQRNRYRRWLDGFECHAVNGWHH